MRRYFKGLYYLIPFAVLPAMLQVCDYIGGYLIREAAIGILYGMLFLISVTLGFFSPTKHAFDRVLLLLVPISMCWAIIIEGYFDRAYCWRSMDNAIGRATDPRILALYASMALIAFLASWQRVRYYNLRKKKA